MYMKKSFDLTILNQKFTIKSDEDERHVKQVADLVNKRMHEIISANQTMSSLHVAILAALNIADEFHKHKNQYNQKIEQWAQTATEMLNRLETHQKV